MKTILISLYRSFSIRYLLNSGLINNLSNNYKIVILTKTENLFYFKKKLKNYNNIFIEDVFYDYHKKIKNNRVADFFILLRRYVSGKKKKFRNKNLYKLWDIKFESELKKKHLYYPIKFFSFFLNNFKILRILLRFFERLTQKSNKYQKYFSFYKPSNIIVASTGYDIDQYLIREAKKNKCKVISFVYSWDNPSTKGYSAEIPDYTFVWNNIMKEEVSIFHDIKRESIYSKGILHWDKYFTCSEFDKINKFKKALKIDKDTKILAFFSSAPNEFDSSIKIIEKILENNNKKLFKNKVHLIARLHPLFFENSFKKFFNFDLNDKIKELTNTYDNITFLNPQFHKTGGNSTFDTDYPIEDLVNTKLIYESCDIFLSEYSTTLIEACIFNKPIINCSFGSYRRKKLPAKTFELHHHIDRAIKANFFKSVYSFEELTSQINIFIENPSIQENNRIKFINEELGGFKGNSVDATYEELKNIIG